MLRRLGRVAAASASVYAASAYVASCEGVKRQDFDALFSPKPPQSLAGKTALVTGASAGIGKATACAFAAEGVNLVLVARREDKLKEIREEIVRRQLPVTVKVIVGDCTNEDVIQAIKAEKVDICVANAGLALGKEPVAKADPADWIKMMEVNTIGAFRTIQAVLPGMIARGGGTVIATGSIAGVENYEGGSVYCASKHAVHAFMEALRFETHAQNIKVATVAPGIVGEGTEFSEVRFKGDKATAGKVYENIDELKATDVATQILWVAQQPPNVCLDFVLVKPTAQGSAQRMHRAAA